jgi:hypothetical protein
MSNNATSLQAVSRFFPSRVQALNKFTKCIAFAIAPNGTGTPSFVTSSNAAGDPTFIDSAGVSSVTRNSAGVFTVVLTDQFKNLISGLANVQLASASSSYTAAKKVVGSATAVFTVTAGANSPGVLGNNLSVTVTQSVLASLKIGTTNSFTVTAGADYIGNAGGNITVQVLAGTGTLGVTTNGTAIVVQLDTVGTLPANIATAFNAAIDPSMAVCTAHTGTAVITAASGPTSLSGQVGWGSTTYVYTDGTNMTVFLPVNVTTGVPIATSGATVQAAITAQVDTGYMVASAGGVGTIVAAVKASLAGGVSGNASAVAQLGAISGNSSSGTLGGSVVVRVVDPEAGTGLDIAAATGNQINVELLVQTE